MSDCLLWISFLVFCWHACCFAFSMGFPKCRVSVSVAGVGIVEEEGVGSFLLGGTWPLRMGVLRLAIQRKLMGIDFHSGLLATRSIFPSRQVDQSWQERNSLIWAHYPRCLAESRTQTQKVSPGSELRIGQRTSQNHLASWVPNLADLPTSNHAIRVCSYFGLHFSSITKSL